MPDVSWDVALDYPMKIFSEKIENIRGRFATKHEHHWVIEFSLPVKSQKVLVHATDGNVSISTPQFCQERAFPGFVEGLDCISK